MSDVDTGLLIAAAEAHASAYDDDPREGIKADLLNAFYAGTAWQAAARDETRDQRLADLEAAAWPIALWWVMIEAQEELVGDDPRVTLPDSMVILNFMGSGASTMVTVGQLRALAKTLRDDDA